jgi:hyperosmotically inducible protein
MKSRILATLAMLSIAVAVPAHAQKTAGDVVDDNTVNASVKAALVGDETTDAAKINVETYKGVVLLSGFVPTQEQKTAAGKVAAGVSGVKKVENKIAVGTKTSTGQKLDDSMLTGKVKAALVDTKDVKSGQINVESNDGVVQLGGFVTSAAMAERAVKAAAAVEGVKRVDNALLVKPQE